MKNLLILISVFLLSHNLFGQTSETVYSNSNDSTSNYYIAFKPDNGQVNGLLLLLASFGETPEIASYETDMYKTAADKGIVTVFASLQYGPMTFFVDSLSQSNIDKLIFDLQKKYNIDNKPFFMGGFSLGGSGVVKYAERAYSSTTLIKPKAIFAIDPPLDFERWYLSLEQTARQSAVEVSKKEAYYFMNRIHTEFHSTPNSDRTPFHIISPYSYSDTLQTNIKKLVNCPLMFICEPDIIWQMEERNRSLYDLHILDCSSAINSLRLLGNKNATLVITTGKGYRKISGRRNPHSWSIADSKQTIDWLLIQ